MKLLTIIVAVILMGSLSACGKTAELETAPNTNDEQSQLVPRDDSASRTPVKPANPEQSFETGQIVGEALSNAWTDLKSFGSGVWSELKNGEEVE